MAAMLLTATRAVGVGPPAVAGEVTAGLHFQGLWQGAFASAEEGAEAPRVEVRRVLRPARGRGRPPVGELRIVRDGLPPRYGRCTIADEGNGKLRMDWLIGRPSRGIYKQEGDRVVICVGTPGGARPMVFRAGKGQYLLRLRRVKSAP